MQGRPTAVVAEPFFLEAPGGRRFAVHHRPVAGPVRGHLLCVPPFNEEMNRCRSMVTLQAAALARIGYGTLVVDLAGTGDSEGGFGDARWEAWLDDVRAGAAWLAKQPGGLCGLIGIRLGAVLAAQVRAAMPDSALALVLWQPVVEGKVHLTQFLRVRMAAQLDRPDVPKETTASMRQQLESGIPVEVAGYEIHPQLAASIDAARLADHAPPRDSAVFWLENASGESPQLSVPGRKVVDGWGTAGVRVEARMFEGAAFWQVHERVLTPSVVEATTHWLDAQGGIA